MRPLIVLLLLLSVSVANADDHAVFYIDKGACPFECCKYGKWRVGESTRLYSELKAGSPFVGVAEHGDIAYAETGEVHTKPGKFVVKRDARQFKKDDILWLYTYVGEGFYKVWRDGRLVEEDIGVDFNDPRPDDWGYFETPPESVWWVKIRTPKGLVGWTNQPENFSNKDACE
jgi:hypothetical protein